MSTFSAASTMLLRDERCERRDIEASERRDIRSTVQDLFCTPKVSPREPDNGLSTSSRVSTANEKEFQIAQPSNRRVIMSPALVSSDQVVLSATAHWMLSRLVLLEQRDRCTIGAEEACAAADIVSAVFLRPPEALVQHQSSHSIALQMSVRDASETSLFLQTSELLDEGRELSEPTSYYSNVLDCVVLKGLTLAPRVTPARLDTTIGVITPGCSPRRPRSMMILSGFIQRGDVLALINGHRVWRINEVRQWEATIDASQQYYITLLRQGRKIHIRVGM